MRSLLVPAVLTAAVAGWLLAFPPQASPHDEARVRPALPDRDMPIDWVGDWEVEVEYRHPSTGRLIAIDTAATSFCPGDQLGLSMYAPKPHEGCSVETEEDRLEFRCSLQVAHRTCRLIIRAEAALARAADSLIGRAEWRIAEAWGDCTALLAAANPGESIRLTGTRTSADPSGCSEPPASLVEKLLTQPDLMAQMPAPIEDLAAHPVRRGVRLSWNGVKAARAYEVLRAPRAGSYQTLAVVPHRPHRPLVFLDGDATASDHRYVVRWIAADGRVSPVSNEATATAEVQP